MSWTWEYPELEPEIRRWPACVRDGKRIVGSLFVHDEADLLKMLAAPDLIAENARLREANEALARACGGVRWRGNNLHNIKASPDDFRTFYEAVMKDAEDALALNAKGAPTQ